MSKKGLSTDSYKGVRDFYPEDMAVQQYIFDNWRKTAESFGYVQYDASILEPSDLYKNKGAENEELVNDQSYTFTDRGDREVTLRPEMTPTAARMIAGKSRDIAFPARWYSIPNLFRYEKPQRGRLREHWQLNCDIFGSDSVEADVETIALAHQVFVNFGADKVDFKIRINDRQLMADFFTQKHGITDPKTIQKITGIFDRMQKVTSEVFDRQLKDVSGDKFDLLRADLDLPINDFVAFLNTESQNLRIIKVIAGLNELGIEVEFDPTLARGFNYYTGTIFEIFDTSGENNRALAGGGRYDNLTSMFGGDSIPGIGFGMGDVALRDFLETHNLLPTQNSSTQLHICRVDDSTYADINTIAMKLRENGVNVSIDMTGKKLGDQIKRAERNAIPYIMVVGSDEIASGNFEVKKLSDGTVTKATVDTIATIVTPHL